MPLSISSPPLALAVHLRTDRPHAPLYRIALAVVVHRIDAWGPAAISAGLALVVHDAVTPAGLALVGAMGVWYWLAYGVNDCFDAPCDAHDPGKARTNPFVWASSSPQALRAATLAVTAVLLVVFGSFGVRSVLLFALGTIVMWAYSAPPLRLKSRPGLDLLTHAAFVLTFPYLFVILLFGQPWSVLDVLLLALGFMASIGGQLNQQIRDCDVDVSTDRNFTTTFGVRTSMALLRVTTSLTLIVLAGGLVAGVLPPVALPLVVLCLPAIVNRLRAEPNRKPPGWLYGGLTIVALMYSTAVLWGALR
jgi:4-hydroxybenzoate polyprenyltransferase